MDLQPPPKPRDIDTIENNERWASLLPDLLLDIFRCLEASAVVACAGACKPWRRTVIGNASTLRPRPDRFAPGLLLGIFEGYEAMRLLRKQGPFQSTLPMSEGDSCGGDLLSSRDGFILLKDTTTVNNNLCLCNPMTGDWTFLPAATVDEGYCMYLLVTGYDLSPSGTRDDLAVRIIAVEGDGMMRHKDDRITYQLFSFMPGGDGAGVWGQVKRSRELENKKDLVVNMIPGNTVVCRDAVHWLARPDTFRIACTVALDCRTGRTWTTELPKPCQFSIDCGKFLLATSGDGRLSLIRTRPGHQIHVWVLIGDDGQWTLRQTIDVRNQVPLPPDCRVNFTCVTAFSPRSGCVVGMVSGQELRIHIESGSIQRIGDLQKYWCYHPYEMDWSTYISKMKQFDKF